MRDPTITHGTFVSNTTLPVHRAGFIRHLPIRIRNAAAVRRDRSMRWTSSEPAWNLKSLNASVIHFR